MSFTKIVATLGPTSDTYEKIVELGEAGVDVFRLNFSHGTHEHYAGVIKSIHRINKNFGKNYSIMLDTKGPEIRSADLKAPIKLEDNQEIILSVDTVEYEKTGKIQVNYEAFIDDIEEKEIILIDNGIMKLEVVKKKGRDIICRVVEGGELGSRRHINLPMKEASLEPITKKDWRDIEFGVEHGVDFFALSFVRDGKEVERLRNFLKEKGSRAHIISKIESFEATKNLDYIVQVSDGVMVARGDLGAEVPFSSVPRLQREILHISAQYRKISIVATHMLESMIENPMPTRAEATDISNAVWQRSDAIMLSGETANGAYPRKSVEIMREVADVSEEDCLKERKTRERASILNDREEIAHLAAQIPRDCSDVAGIMVVTRSGYMARMISSFRPCAPILAFTNETFSRRYMNLLWGVKPYLIDFSSDPEKTISRACTQLLKKNPTWENKKIVLIADSLVDGKFVPEIQIRTID